MMEEGVLIFTHTLWHAPPHTYTLTHSSVHHWTASIALEVPSLLL